MIILILLIVSAFGQYNSGQTQVEEFEFGRIQDASGMG